LDVKADDLIRIIKAKIEEKLNIPVDQQRLGLKGIKLEDDRIVSNYGIGKGLMVDLLTPLSLIFIFIKHKKEKSTFENNNQRLNS
jgi:hypothetical protein